MVIRCMKSEEFCACAKSKESIRLHMTRSGDKLSTDDRFIRCVSDRTSTVVKMLIGID